VSAVPSAARQKGHCQGVPRLRTPRRDLSTALTLDKCAQPWSVKEQLCSTCRFKESEGTQASRLQRKTISFCALAHCRALHPFFSLWVVRPSTRPRCLTSSQIVLPSPVLFPTEVQPVRSILRRRHARAAKRLQSIFDPAFVKLLPASPFFVLPSVQHTRRCGPLHLRSRLLVAALDCM
jgi:hypothetical protein